MCLSPDMPKPPPPPQPPKAPDSAALFAKSRKNARPGMTGGSLLTSPSGVTGATTARASLLGA